MTLWRSLWKFMNNMIELFAQGPIPMVIGLIQSVPLCHYNVTGITHWKHSATVNNEYRLKVG